MKTPAARAMVVYTRAWSQALRELGPKTPLNKLLARAAQIIAEIKANQARIQ